MPERRNELAAFLRSRRARITPEDVGMPPGLRRRTPGLRREEVAQLSGVGVTWYTWLEQGRPINASVQVLDAIARTLRLDVTERQHLYRLAGVPFVRDDIPDADVVGGEVQGIIDALDPLCAVVYNARYDVLASNAAYRDLFPGVRFVGRSDRNVLLRLFSGPSCCSAFVNRDDELPRMVAQMRTAYGRHVGEPAWESFIERMIRTSAEFAQMWASGDVAPPGQRIKHIQHASVGSIKMSTVSLAIDGMPEHRVVVYTPDDEESRARIEQLRSLEDPLIGCSVHARPLSQIVSGTQMSRAL
ncbi:helix-turn-helix transcriptional regulator [Streptomyces sp. NBC_01262]|uniref:helix-turn-helix transcriptional regulator n=1 Tax=Streptomyces sp. NBC_01262 TaxID=2903803 RepID=UPI002E373072|nr:helix-turn-helix transcriptional regulator [Streptomyces sp. NBC_01262]